MSQPWGHPQQPGSYPYPPPGPGPGQLPPARRRRRGLVITLAVVVVLAAVVVGVGLFGLAKRTADQGLEDPKVPPLLAAPPSNPLPARRSPYPTLPASCSLLTSKTVQAVYPGATAKEGPTSDRNLLGLKQFSRRCTWEFVTGDYIRFVMVQARGMSSDEDAEDTIADSYRAEIARLGPSIFMPKVDGRRSPRLGDEATLIYGSGGEACRIARVLVRSRNVQFEAMYGGCDRKPGQLLPITPIDETTAINGALTMARDVLQQINKT
jgi:hypothetical protein